MIDVVLGLEAGSKEEAELRPRDNPSVWPPEKQHRVRGGKCGPQVTKVAGVERTATSPSEAVPEPAVSMTPKKDSRPHGLNLRGVPEA